MHKNVFNTLQNRLNENQLRLNSINHEKSCVWLTSYPINDHGFGLTKQQYPANNVCNDVWRSSQNCYSLLVKIFPIEQQIHALKQDLISDHGVSGLGVNKN